ncbi:tripartite tricarboxylate transporter TctB family protein [Hydrogenophaga bisanensis]|uniref:Tripartite tricarboxylate transporter TctB family protein n=1 Tax=Hydrogenophaga bisanensis TaxID=439611 RepID=A0ABW2RCH3_9BURK|nr:tripartite tricarboxylate transporter TctB family protein [Hydrogenophaga sp.]
MALASQKDFFSGLMFTAVGGAFAWGAREYEIGEAARMGPGYFPFVLGILLAILGMVIMFKSFTSGPPGGDRIGAFAWRPMVFILGANLAFGALLAGVPALGLPAFGLVVAIYALVVIASFARPGASLKESLILATILAVGCYVAFVYLLKLQFPVWPAFLTN